MSVIAVARAARVEWSRRAAELWTSSRVQLVTAATVYVVATLVLTWPMPAHPGTTIFGVGGDAFSYHHPELSIFGRGGDAFAYLSDSRELVEHRLVPFLPGTNPDFNAPEGLPVPYSFYLASWASVLPRYVLAAVFGPVAGYDIFVLSGFILTGLAMFLLARRLSGSAVAGLVGGWIFAFYPFAIAKAQVHPDYMHGWVLVLLLWRLLELRRHPTSRNGVLAGAASLLAVSFNPYFILMAFVMQATLAVADLLLARREGALRSHLKAQAAAAMPPVVALELYALVNATASTSYIRIHPIGDAYVFGARLLEYLVPSSSQTLLGDVTRGFWNTHLHGSNVFEASLYLGWTVLALALLALYLARKRYLDTVRTTTVGLLSAVGVAALCFSFPPSLEIGGVPIYTPTWVVYQLTSTWRAFERVGIVVMLATALLAAIGLAGLVRRARPRMAAVVTAAAVVLVPADLWARPSPATLTFSHPWVFTVLAAEPPGIVAEYPLRPSTLTALDAEYYQDQHGHPMLNYYPPGSREEARALWLARLNDPATAPRLSLLGVRNVVLDVSPSWPGLPDAGLPTRRGFSELASSGGRTLYRVTAAPARSLTWPAQGFSLPEGTAGAQFAWLVSASGELDTIARCAPCRGHLRFKAWSFAQPRQLLLSLNGRILFEGQVDAAPRVFSVPIVFNRRARIAIRVFPGPQSVREAVGGPDPRSLAVAFQEPHLRLSK